MSTRTRFTENSDPACYPPRMTRAEAIARRTAGTLRENCVVVVTDGPTIGTVGNTSPTEIELNPTSPTELGLTARVFTTFDNSAWAGLYDIDLGVAGSITRLEDSSGNVAVDIDADSPTVHTQFPWHLGTTIGGNWRDNYAEDTVFTSPDDTVGHLQFFRNTFKGTTMDFTGWVGPGGNFADNYVEGTGTHHITGPFATWLSNRIEGGSTVNGHISMTNARIDGTSNLNAPTIGASVRMTITNSEIVGSNLTTDISTLTVNTSRLTSVALTNDVGTVKTISVTDCTMDTFTVHTTGTGTGGFVAGNSQFWGRPSAAPLDSILVQGSLAAGSASFQRCTIDCGVNGAGPAWSIDGLGGVILADSIVRSTRITKGVGAGAFQIANGCDFLGGTIIADGGGATSATSRFSATFTRMTGCLLQMLPATTGNLVISNSELTNSTIEMTSGARDLLVDDTKMIGVSQAGNYIKQTSVSDTAVGNRVLGCEILANGRIDFNDTNAAATLANGVSYSKVMGQTLGGAFGRILIQGISQAVGINNCEVIDGIFTITDDNATGQPATHYYNIKVGQGGTFTVTNPASVAVSGQRRFKDIEVSGEAAVFSSVNMTGGPNFDISRIKVNPGCAVNFLGSVVAPCQDILMETLSTLNIDPGASVQQWRQGMETIVSTGPFQHFWNIYELHAGGLVNIPFTCTGPNQNALRNAGFDNFV